MPCGLQRFLYRDGEEVGCDTEDSRLVCHDIPTGELTEISGGVKLAELVGQRVAIAYG